MINSIPTIEQKPGSFGQFSTKPNSYWLREQSSMPESQPDKKNQPGAVSSIAIASSAVLGITGLAFLIKNQKGLSKKLKGLRDNIASKFKFAKSDGKITFADKITVYAGKIVNNVLKRSEAFNNFTSVKDYRFKKLMGYNKITWKIHDNITEFFGNIARKSVDRAYSKTYYKIDDIFALTGAVERKVLNEGNPNELIARNGVKKTRAQWLEQARNLQRDLQRFYDANFNKQAFSNRYYSEWGKAAGDLEKEFSLKIFSKDFVSGFAAEKKFNKLTESARKSVIGKQHDISYTLAELEKDCSNKISEMTNLINYGDVAHLKSLKNIKDNISKYAKNPTPELKEKMLKSLDMFEVSVGEAVTAKTMDIRATKELTEATKELRNAVATYKPGRIQELKDIYKDILPEKEYKKVAKAYDKVSKSLSNSVKTETNDFLDKLRDFSLGSAPTDILTLLSSFGAFGYYFIKAKNGDERESIAIKYGVPAIAGIGTTLYLNAKLYAGATALFISIIISSLLNKIGSEGDIKLKAFKQNLAEKRLAKEAEKQKVLETEIEKNPPVNV